MAAYNFPNSPSDGDTVTSNGITYTYSSSKTRWDGAAPSGSSTTVYATIDDLPLSGASTGDQAYVSGNNRLYIWNGTGWYNIALINTTPSISGAASSYTLASDGTATTVTITATDPEGIPITYSIASDTSGNVATVTQGTGANTNVFTITPSTNTANAGTFSLTFRASDGVNIATAVSSFELQFSVANSNYTTALITSVGANNAVNNSFIDSSTNSHTITANGNVTQGAFSPYRHGGYSTYFDGNGDYLKVADSTEHEFGTGDFSIEFWWWPESLTGGTGGLHIAISAPNDSHNQLIYNESTYWYYGAGSGGAVKVGSSGNGPATAKAWNHVVLCRTGTTLSIFHNGTRTGSTTSSYSADFSNASIGRYDSGGYEIDGYIRDMRWLKGSSAYDATQTSITVPTEPLTAITNTTLLTCHLPYIADGSTNGHSITVNGNTKTEPFSPYTHGGYSTADNGGSIYFDGTGDYLTGPSDSSFNFTGEFCVDFWYYGDVVKNGTVFQTHGTNAGGWSFGINSSNFKIYRVGFQATNSTTIVAGRWYHVRFNRDSNNDLRVFVNGVSGTTVTDATTTAAYTAPTIGLNSSYAPESVQGYISDLRVVNGSSLGTSNFTPPTAPLTAITNTSLLLSGTNAGIIDKSQSVKTLTLNGDVKSSTTQSKYLSSSMYFDGTGDYLELSRGQDLDIFNLGTSDFTVEMWLFPTDLSNSGTIISFIRANNTSDDNHPHIYRAASELRFYTDGTDKISGGTLSLSTWHHVAISRSGNDHKMFLDGSQVGSTYTASNTYTQGRPVVASYNDTLTTVGSANLFTGYISDVRITKGLARYTSNFTPPTAVLAG